MSPAMSSAAPWKEEFGAKSLDFRKKPIFVLGIDRSGTSLLSEVIHRWGANSGKQDLLCRSDQGNPQGYWEYKPMQDFIGDLIDSVGVSIWAPEFEGLLEKRALDPSLEQRALKLAFEMGSPERPWFWKDAMLISVIPFLRRVFPEAVYLITLRNPHDSASSYEKLLVPEALRGKIRLVEYTYLRWQHFMLTIFEELKNYKGRLLVPYETLVSSPREQCTRISRFLDTEYGLTEGAGVRIERMEQSINPRLWRNRSRVSFLDREDAPSVSKELFAYLLSRVDGDLGDFDPSKYPLPEWSREYCSNMSVMGWLLNSL